MKELAVEGNKVALVDVLLQDPNSCIAPKEPRARENIVEQLYSCSLS